MDVCEARPDEEEAGEGERVGGEDPLLAGGGDGEVVGDCGEDDYGCLDREGLGVLLVVGVVDG